MKTTAFLIVYFVALVALSLWLAAKGHAERHRRDYTTPQPAPINYLEWRAPMPPQHSTDQLRVTL